MKQGEKTEKVFLRFDTAKSDRLSNEVNTICDFINDKVTPRAEALKLTPTFENVVKWACGGSASMDEDFIQAATDTSTGNKQLDKLIKDNAAKEAAELAEYDARIIKKEVLTFFEVKGGRAVPNNKEINEAAKVYMPESFRESYNRYLRAVEAVNEFLQGNAPDGYLGSLFPVKDGKVIFTHNFMQYATPQKSK